MSQLSETRIKKLFDKLPMLKLIREIGSDSQFKSRIDYTDLNNE